MKIFNHINIEKSFGIMINTVFLMLVSVLSVSLLIDSVPQKIFYLSSYLCVLIFAVKCKGILSKRMISKDLFLLATSFFLFGLLRVLWTGFIDVRYGALSDISSSILNDYELSGKRFMLGSFIVMVMALYNNKISEQCLKMSKIIIWVGAVVTLYFGAKEYAMTHSRIFLTANAPSSTAYMVIFMYCAYLWLPMLKMNNKWLIADAVLMIAIFILVILTGTRIALVAYGFITLYQVSRHYGLLNILKPIRNRIVAVFIIIAVAFISGNRWIEAFDNLKDYDTNSSTSLGARVAIWDSGIHFFSNHPGFNSPDVRTTTAREYIARFHPGNAEGYKNVQSNMHNELLDVATLQGIAGLVSLLFIYFVVLRAWLNRNELKGIIMPAAALFIMGMVDTVLFFPATTMLFIISAALCTFTGSSNKQHIPMLLERD
ncbi:O-antigen ligase family protein [Pantoea allii]|uniref:O-antigen ligase family protein n=1 Tax=Pantoea allii TaxID=574096 RepID=UPI0039776DA6